MLNERSDRREFMRQQWEESERYLKIVKKQQVSQVAGR